MTDMEMTVKKYIKGLKPACGDKPIRSYAARTAVEMFKICPIASLFSDTGIKFIRPDKRYMDEETRILILLLKALTREYIDTKAFQNASVPESEIAALLSDCMGADKILTEAVTARYVRAAQFYMAYCRIGLDKYMPPEHITTSIEMLVNDVRTGTTEQKRDKTDRMVNCIKMLLDINPELTVLNLTQGDETSLSISILCTKTTSEDILHAMEEAVKEYSETPIGNCLPRSEKLSFSCWTAARRLPLEIQAKHGFLILESRKHYVYALMQLWPETKEETV